MSKSELMGRLLKSKRAKNKLGSTVNHDSLSRHVAQAEPLVFIVIFFATGTLLMLGYKSFKLPVLGYAVRAFLALCELHRKLELESSKNGKLSDSFQICEFSPDRYDEVIIGSGPGGAIAGS